MAKASELTVEVNAKVTVSDETANRCLRILEMWQEDNPDKSILCEQEKDGRTVMTIVKWGGNSEESDE